MTGCSPPAPRTSTGPSTTPSPGSGRSTCTGWSPTSGRIAGGGARNMARRAVPRRPSAVPERPRRRRPRLGVRASTTVRCGSCTHDDALTGGERGERRRPVVVANARARRDRDRHPPLQRPSASRRSSSAVAAHGVDGAAVDGDRPESRRMYGRRARRGRVRRASRSSQPAGRRRSVGACRSRPGAGRSMRRRRRPRCRPHAGGRTDSADREDARVGGGE